MVVIAGVSVDSYIVPRSEYATVWCNIRPVCVLTAFNLSVATMEVFIEHLLIRLHIICVFHVWIAYTFASGISSFREAALYSCAAKPTSAAVLCIETIVKVDALRKTILATE